MLKEPLQEIRSAGGVAESPVGQAGVLDFNFDYLDFQFSVRTETEAGRCKIQIQSSLGCIPFSAESRHNRAGVLDIIKAARLSLRGQLQVEDGRWIVLSAGESLDKPLDAVTLLAGLTRFLVLAKPYLNLLSEQIKRPGLSIRAIQ